MEGTVLASAGLLFSNQARILTARLKQESQGLRRRLLLCEAPYIRTGSGALFFLWKTSPCSGIHPSIYPQITAEAPQCQVLFRAQTKTRQDFLSFQPRKKKQPPPVSPPAPTVPVNSAPIMIICCCTCRGLYVSRDVEVRGLLRGCDFRVPGCGRV